MYYFLPKNTPLSEPEYTVLVLPFDNNLGTDTLEYFLAGMHEALITNLSKVSALRVICKTTARAYNNSEKPLKEIAAEVGIDIVIRASVLCAEDNICLEVNMANPNDEEEPFWDQEYNNDKSLIFNIYNKLTKEVSYEINVTLRPEEERLLSESRGIDPEAIDAYLKGINCFILNPDSLNKAKEYYQIAIEKEPDWAPPYIGLANVWNMLGLFDAVPKAVANAKSYAYMDTSLTLAPNSAEVHYMLGLYALWNSWDFENAEKKFLKSIELGGNVLGQYALLLTMLRRNEEAVYQANLNLKLDPMNPNSLGAYAIAMFMVGDFRTAITHYEKALSINPSYGWIKGNLIQAYYSAGEYDKWFELWKSTVCWDDELLTILERVYYEHGHIATIKELLRLHKEYENEDCWMQPEGYLYYYLKLKNYERALDYLEIMYNNSNGNMLYMATDINGYEHLKDNPRYIGLIKKMNLPID